MDSVHAFLTLLVACLEKYGKKGQKLLRCQSLRHQTNHSTATAYAFLWFVTFNDKFGVTTTIANVPVVSSKRTHT